MLTCALRCVSVDAMMILTSGAAFSNSGSAVSPSITGISMSSTITSTSLRDICDTASWPFPTVATTWMPESVSNARVIKPRITAESSTTITRTGDGPEAAVFVASAPFDI